VIGEEDATLLIYPRSDGGKKVKCVCLTIIKARPCALVIYIAVAYKLTIMTHNLTLFF
jgi:hypothetical protein